MSSVDLPPPETPVMQVKRPSGISAVTFFRLFSRAPMTVSTLRFVGRAALASASGSGARPRGTAPVRLSGFAMMSSGVPCATTLAAVDAGAGADVDHVVGRA